MDGVVDSDTREIVWRQECGGTDNARARIGNQVDERLIAET